MPLRKRLIFFGLSVNVFMDIDNFFIFRAGGTIRFVLKGPSEPLNGTHLKFKDSS